MKKSFALPAADIRPLAPGRGSCYASDRITVERHPVGFMYREPPDNEIDSGWRFLSDEDDQEYVDDPKNFEIYDVNTIANYDPSIIEYLDAPVFSAFERRPEESRFVAVPFPG
jgi:hypothetical protein